MFIRSLLKIVGLQTADFAVYYDVVQALRARDVPFVPLAEGDAVPLHVGVVITSAAEAILIDHPHVVAHTTPEETVAHALRLLQAPDPFRQVIIGIDPGERPGLAVLGDGKVVRLVHCANPEAVRGCIEGVLTGVPAARYVVRVGNGAPTFRDRILHTLAGLDATLELVDERRSTPVGTHGNAARDTMAATAIALTPGYQLRLSDLRPARPSEGELRDIQRKSRIASQGGVTISRALARHVALGRLTLDEAVDRMRQKA